MGFIESFFKGKEKITSKDVSLFISQKIEENRNLDYKDIDAYHDADKLSISIASFANSEGGLIILGVSENKIADDKGKIRRIYPNEITWGKMSLDKESLENKLVSRIEPSITNLVIRPVRNDKGEAIFLIDIPKSDLAPHMSSDHKYHRRANFRTRVMEHYEVANLFKINWTMKEKLVEKIYEPLSSILEKHAKQLREHSCPDGRDFEEILSRTYYKTQMPFELLEQIDYYIDRISDLNKNEYSARRTMLNIVSKNVLEYLKKTYHLSDDKTLSFDLGTDMIHALTKSRTHYTNLDVHVIYKLLLTRRTIRTYIKSEHWQDAYEEIRIHYSDKDYCINLDEFDKLIWKKCLKEASENAEIMQMKESAEALSEEAWSLIEQIMKY